jgi:hypothetical protein
MGWTSTHRDTATPVHDFLVRELIPAGMRVIDHATVSWNTYYAAVEHLDGAYKGKVFAIVVLLKHAPNDYYNISYKAMDESCGPVEDRCPIRILDKLSPLGELGYSGSTLEWAQSWRDRCRARKAKKMPKPGDKVTFESPFKFTNGETIAEFIYRGGAKFTQPFSSLRYHIRGWKDTKFTITEAA